MSGPGAVETRSHAGGGWRSGSAANGGPVRSRAGVCAWVDLLGRAGAMGSGDCDWARYLYGPATLGGSVAASARRIGLEPDPGFLRAWGGADTGRVWRSAVTSGVAASCGVPGRLVVTGGWGPAEPAEPVGEAVLPGFAAEVLDGLVVQDADGLAVRLGVALDVAGVVQVLPEGVVDAVFDVPALLAVAEVALDPTPPRVFAWVPTPAAPSPATTSGGPSPENRPAALSSPARAAANRRPAALARRAGAPRPSSARSPAPAPPCRCGQPVRGLRRVLGRAGGRPAAARRAPRAGPGRVGEEILRRGCHIRSGRRVSGVFEQVQHSGPQPVRPAPPLLPPL